MEARVRGPLYCLLPCSEDLRGHGTLHNAESKVTRGTLEPQLSQPHGWEGATRGEACSPGAQAPRMSWDCGGGAGRLCLGQGNFSATRAQSLAAPAQDGRPGQLGVGVEVPNQGALQSLVSRAPGGLQALGRAPRRRILSGAWKGLAGMAGPEPSLHTNGLSRVPKLKGDVKPGPAPGVWAV